MAYRYDAVRRCVGVTMVATAPVGEVVVVLKEIDQFPCWVERVLCQQVSLRLPDTGK